MTNQNTALICASASLLAAVFANTPLLAQSGHGDDELIPLDEINVTGTGLPTEVLNSPASVTVVTAEEIADLPPRSVASVLSDVPGIRVDEQGIERIRIRGESSQRVAILIDGQRVSDHTTYGTPILISPTEIERIEVVRGPSSVVSGNRAIGGVINIITKRGADAPLEVTASAGYLGGNDGYRGSLSAAGTVGNFDYRLSFSKSHLNDRETPDGPLVPSGGDDRDIHAFLGYRLNNHYFGLRARDFDLSADVFTGDPDFQISLPKRDLRKYSAFYEGSDLTPWMSFLKVDAYTQKIDRQFRNDVTFAAGPATMNVVSTSDDEQTTSGLRATANLEFAPGHRTVVGFEYEDDRLVADKSTARSMIPPFSPPSVTTRFSDATIRTAGAFGQHEITTGNLITTAGVRYYNVKSDLDQYLVDGVAEPSQSNNDDRFLGSLGFVYLLPNETTVRANISQGYTYPSLSELFLTTTAGGGTTLGNPNLKPETATNYELGLRMNQPGIVLDTALFYTQSRDYIARINTGVPRVDRYENVDNVDSWGFEVAAEFDPGWLGGIRPYLVLSNVTREFSYQSGLVTKDSGTPAWTGSAGLRSEWTAGSVDGTWDLFVRGESNAVQRNDADTIVEQTAGWTTVNLRGSAALTRNVDLTFEIDNIFDRTYRSIDQLEGAGRSVSLFLTARF